MIDVKISVRKIVEFLYSGGHLSNEYFQNKDMLEGIRTHQYWQKKYGLLDRKEVSVFYEHYVGDCSYEISGIADGVLGETKEVIEEIKSTKRPLNELTISSRPEHLAQAKMYAYIYMKNNDLKSIRVRLTYINTIDYSFKSFDKKYNETQLNKFFVETLDKYDKWYRNLRTHFVNFIYNLQEIKFPFTEYRDGQRDLMAACYQTVKKKDILYVMSPTGVGKTMATLFSTLKTISNEKQKIFYLTAKNAGKTVVMDAVKTLVADGFIGKTIEITSKDSMCFLDEKDCTPDACKYAKGFFNRLKTATEDMYSSETIFSREKIIAYAKKHTICPFEYSLYLSYFANVVVCDYNYVFCPKSHLKRYFEEKEYEPILLVDEAHNMVSRSKSMFSADIKKTSIVRLKGLVKKLKPTIKTELKMLTDAFSDFKESELDFKENLDISFVDAFERLFYKLNKVLTDNSDFHGREETLDIYFEMNDFSRILEYYNDSYRMMIEKYDNEVKVSLFCFDGIYFVLNTVKEYTYGSVCF